MSAAYPWSGRLGLVVAASLIVLSACSSDDDPADPNGDATIVGSWQATSFTALGTDFIAGGMTLAVTLSESNTYTFTVTGDEVGICGDEGPDCMDSGPYAATETQVTIDAGLEDEVTFSYSIVGSNMSWSGAIDGIPAMVTWVRTD
jgi:hypothetical protein